MKYLDQEEKQLATPSPRNSRADEDTGTQTLAAEGPIKADESRKTTKLQVNHICSFPSIPARLIGS
ncbi:hypothetical protein J2Y48_004462 [Mycoplana sp. BE70]|uniref:hypothetical protein n=1 Tax=Mycoplana sp. BE70 TaxID=2817775 RepID=UPI0028544213|nr:hypothetical protein [Mycoplana sp. BE70]MDR6759146.1 hypothetical protein [Mycoplana sp. BE70]